MSDKIATIFGLSMILMFLAGVYGWIMNIINLVGASYEVITGQLVVGIIGVFIPPVGAIMGLFVW